MAEKSAGTNEVLAHGRKEYNYDGTNWRASKADTAGNQNINVLNTETIQTELLSAQSIASSTVVLSSTLSVVGIKQATIYIDHGRNSTAAFGTQGTEYRVEASQKASGNDTWRTLAAFVCASTVCSSAISAGTAAPGAGASTITITSATAFAVGDIVMWANTSSAASIEWAKVIAVSGTATFTVLDGITNAQGSTQIIYNQAEQFALTLDVKSITRLRVAVNNVASGTTQSIYSRIACITMA